MDNKLSLMTDIMSGSNKVYNIDIKKYIDDLLNILSKFQNNIYHNLNFKIIDPDKSSISVKGNILYLQYINEYTFHNIDNFLKNKFDLKGYNNLINCIKKDIFNQKKYAIFIFIKSDTYSIPLIIDDYDLYLEITHNNEIIFNTIDYIN